MKNLITSNSDPDKIVHLLTEVAYAGNMGFQEMMVFYQKASDQQIEELERLLRKERFKKAWNLVQDVTGVNLKGKEFN